jgi:hypothetical protein
MDLLASTRTAVLLLALIAVAAAAGTLLPDPAARKYVYGRLWFHVLLGLLGLNLAACMAWRRRFGMARIWSLLTHGGILLILVGAMVTLILAERGLIVIYEGEELNAFIPEGRGGQGAGPTPLGFAVRLVDFRLDYYPPVDYLYVMRRGEEPVRLRVSEGRPLAIPGTECRLTGARVITASEGPSVRISMPDGTSLSVPAEVGTTQELDAACQGQPGRRRPPDSREKRPALRILRYEPSFKRDNSTGEVFSDTCEPLNPALEVALVRDGETEPPRWLFATTPDSGRVRDGAKEPEEVTLRFLHPDPPRLEAVATTPSGPRPVRLTVGRSVHSPWDTGLFLAYWRERPVKEFQSEVHVLEEGRVVRRHVIQVNSPLVHRGTKLSQSAYDERGLRWTELGVSRDSGVWFVYAGFITMMLGLMGRFYVGPLVRQLRAGGPAEGGDDGSS